MRLTTYDGGDYFVSPYLAVAVPYWFIVFGSLATLPVSLVLCGNVCGKPSREPVAQANGEDTGV